MNFTFSKFIYSMIFTSLLVSHSSFGMMGGNTSGGGDPKKVDAGAIQLLIQGNGLKTAMLNYLKTVPVDQIQDKQVQNLFNKLVTTGVLSSDILKSRYFVKNQSQEHCRDAFNNEVSASTIVGLPTSAICFDVQKIAKAYKGFNDEEIMIHLSALAFHEHIHHFQKSSEERTNIQFNEDEANHFAGYVLITAKFVQLPLLRWTNPNNSIESYIQAIEQLRTLLKAKEEVFIAPSDSDFINYPNYRNQKDRGIMRLLPREKYDRVLSINGGGAYYSFSKLTHEYGFGSDIELEKNKLDVGFAGCDYGFFVKLGKQDLSSDFENFPELNFMMNYIPPMENEPLVRAEQRKFSYSDNIENGITYLNDIRNPSIGDTFGLRSIIYGEQRGSDIVVVFKIIDQRKDGSLTIAWRILQQKSMKECGKRS